MKVHHNVVILYELEGNGGERTDCLRAPVTVQCVQRARPVEVKRLSVQLGQVADTHGRAFWVATGNRKRNSDESK